MIQEARQLVALTALLASSSVGQIYLYDNPDLIIACVVGDADDQVGRPGLRLADDILASGSARCFQELHIDVDARRANRTLRMSPGLAEPARPPSRQA
jgi:hypothetical protein